MKTLSIALLGAGGKMGCRITAKLKDRPEFALSCIEVAPAGIENLRRLGVAPVAAEAVLPTTDAVILAVPDRLIGTITAAHVPTLRPGCLVIGLDPAAAYAGVMPERADISYFVTHPCHPPLFGDTAPAGPDSDWFGARDPQSIVCALHQGPEEHYAMGEAIARAMWAPIIRSHRITVEQMALLEPAVVESTGICCVMVMKEAMEIAIAKGVPREAAWDFVMGHIRTELAIVFGYAGFPFSDGAKKAVEQNMRRIFRDDWRQVLEIPAVRESVREITHAINPH